MRNMLTTKWRIFLYLILTVIVSLSFTGIANGSKGRIAFALNGDIWAIDTDGSNLQRLTFSAADETHPHWSEDGSQIAYTNWDDGIHVMNADGTGDYHVPNTVGRVGEIGPDLVQDWGPCSQILFSTEEPDGIGAVYEINPDGTGRKMLTDGDDGDHPPAGWSPDCTQFVFADGIPFVSGSAKVAISPRDHFDPIIIYGPDSKPCEWSPDGEWILFYHEGALWKIKPDGTGASPVVPLGIEGTFITNDQIAYSDGAYIWITNLAGKEPQYLTTGRQPDAIEIPGGSIIGRATDCETGEPINFAIVIAAKSGMKEIAIIKPPDDGYYEITDLQPGNWWIIGIKKGYKPHIARVKVESGASTPHDFCLEPR